MTFQLTSSAFADGDLMPARYTCDGKDVSPPLAWHNPPEKTRSLALVCDDPDAPLMTWVHWVLYNIPPDEKQLPEDIQSVEVLENGARHGRNSWQKHRYGGPCLPGKKPHRYVFRLYALDTVLDLEAGAKKKHVLRAMTGHVVVEARLTGRYTRKR